MNNKNTFFKVFRIIGDIIFMNLAFLTAFYLRFFSFAVRNLSAFFEQLPYISVFTVIVMYLYNLYTNQLKKNLGDIFYSFVPSSVIIVFFSVVLSYFLQTYHFPRSVFLIVLPILFIYMVGWRYISIKLEQKFSEPQKIIVVGKNEETCKIVKNINQGTNGGYKFRFFSSLVGQKLD